MTRTTPGPRVNGARASRALALAALAACAAWGATAHAAATEAAADGGAPPAAVLVELFTAEGCSSCPPADQFLHQLDATQPIAGAHLIVLGEHVDYWDRQGWPDPYASKAFTERQVAYERGLHVSEPFTPQFVLDGTIDMRLSRRERISEQLHAAATAPKIPVSFESLRLDRGDAQTTRPTLAGAVRVERVTGEQPCDLIIALALDHADTQVLRGENRGQHLTNVAVLRQLTRIGTVAPGAPASESFRLALPAGLDAAAPLRVIAFVQRPGPGAVLGAAEQLIGP